MLSAWRVCIPPYRVEMRSRRFHHFLKIQCRARRNRVPEWFDDESCIKLRVEYLSLRRHASVDDADSQISTFHARTKKTFPVLYYIKDSLVFSTIPILLQFATKLQVDHVTEVVSTNGRSFAPHVLNAAKRPIEVSKPPRSEKCNETRIVDNN